MPYNLNEISEKLNGILVGDGNVVITGVGSINSAMKGEIAFVTVQNLNKLDACNASALIVPETPSKEFKVPVIKVKNPRLDFIQLINMFSEKTKSSGVISSKAIEPSATLGYNVQIDEFTVVKENVSIGDHTIISAHSFIGKNVTIGMNCLIHPNVTILNDTFIGDNVIVHSGAVIGADGFGFEWDGHKQVKIPHIGNVIISDDVEIGANTAIDRGTIDSTIIGKGTKMDNLIQIGHNVQIGEHCIIAGTSAIGGSSNIGNRVILAAGSAVINNITIGDNCVVLAKTNVSKNLPENSVVSGYIARPHKIHLQQSAALSRLPKTIKKLNEKLDELSRTKAGAK
ncbi:UDP-3-O-(3-hydroxymyristoyl)glucosamine N-acyltransferase [Paenibacillus xylanilyticus]|uniref:UDP-3-O-acylglucosamine N-acyltransferase n=1 Tax=Paenibacillus xylanilyticus TaxID=248903 RepID=A0A7Y6C1G9_9BACL|nr:UDP-3-O-(3-hydroxymyristoyl)glucosamine N-acyltransferase [Paenibacillus xylanilyticus]NUU78408.1 UDP-3-O-(3-hydroxymyristoyl)glucosamine N-acyltransferase [Paenibacillus xylanilyticus]